jgi:MATE family multidrug resistance protein
MKTAGVFITCLPGMAPGIDVVSEMANRSSNIALNTRGPTLQLLALALPIIAMMVSRMMMGFIDFWMVKYLGTTAQAAISPAAMLVFTAACLGMGIANSTQTFVSQADGRNEPEVCGSYAWQTLYVALFCAVAVWPVATATPLWLGWIAEVACHDSAMAQMEIAYTRIALWSVPFAVLSMGFNAFFMGIQRPRVALLAVILSLVVNAIGNYLLIFGKFGFPEMGIAGAAVATVIGWVVRAVFLAGALLLPEFDLRYRTRRSLAWSSRKLIAMLRIGGPTSVQWLVDIGSWLVFLAVIMPPYGVNAVAASNVGLQYMHLSFMPAIGIGIALCSQVGFAIGEGKPDRAAMQARVAMRVTGTFMGAVGVLFVVGGYPLMWLFNRDPAVIHAGQLVLVGAAVFQIFDAMSITYMNSLRGAGDTRWPAVAVFLCCWVIFVGGGVLTRSLLPELGLIGPWATCAAYIIVLGLLLRWRWRRGAWREIRLFETASTDSAEPSVELSAVARTASRKYAD